MKADVWENTKKEFEAYLQQQNMRMIPKRIDVLHTICSCDDHLSVDDVYERLKASGDAVSRATVYNCIELFCKAGFVNKIQGIGDVTLYERASKKPHLHCICVNCGKVKELTDEVLRVAIQTKRIAKFKQQRYALCIYGLCAECEKIENKKQ